MVSIKLQLNLFHQVLSRRTKSNPVVREEYDYLKDLLAHTFL